MVPPPLNSGLDLICFRAIEGFIIVFNRSWQSTGVRVQLGYSLTIKVAILNRVYVRIPRKTTTRNKWSAQEKQDADRRWARFDFN